MADEDVKVVVEDEAPQELAPPDGSDLPKVDAPEATLAPSQPEPKDDLKRQFKELQASAEEDRKARLAAETRANSEREARERISREHAATRDELAEREASSIEAGIAAAQSEASSAETEYKAAFEAGDAAGMATAQRKLARAEAKSIRFDEAKAEIEARKTRPQTYQGAAPSAQTDPVEAYINGRTEPTANWLRSHTDFITDQRKNAKLTAAHWSAIGEGIAVDTPAYFDSVETFLGLKGNGSVPVKAHTRRASAPPVAPGHASGGGTNGGSNEVRLTRGEAAAATDGTIVWNFSDPSPQKRFQKGDPIGIQEMARRKLAMQKDGRYDRTYTDQ